MRAAAHRGGALAVKLLSRGLADESSWVRYYAAQGLGKLGTHDAPNASAQLVDRLHDPAPLVRIAAIEALSRLGSSDAWSAVSRAAASADPDERRAGLVGVGMHGREGATEILSRQPGRRTRPRASSRCRASRACPIRARSTCSLPRSETSAPRSRDAALSLLAERDDDAAARALVDWAVRSPLRSPGAAPRCRGPAERRVVAILARLAIADDVAAPTLVAALARMHAPAATEALFEAMTLPNAASRAAAANALAAIDAHGARAAIQALAATDPDPDVRRICAALA